MTELKYSMVTWLKCKVLLKKVIVFFICVHTTPSIGHLSVAWLTFFVVAIQFRSILIDLFVNHLHTLYEQLYTCWCKSTCKWYFLSLMVHMVKHTDNQIYEAKFISTSSTPIQKNLRSHIEIPYGSTQFQESYIRLLTLCSFTHSKVKRCLVSWGPCCCTNHITFIPNSWPNYSLA